MAVEKSLFKTNIEQKKQLMSYFSKTEFRISHNKLNKNEKKKNSCKIFTDFFYSSSNLHHENKNASNLFFQILLLSVMFNPGEIILGKMKINKTRKLWY